MLNQTLTENKNKLCHEEKITFCLSKPTTMKKETKVFRFMHLINDFNHSFSSCS